MHLPALRLALPNQADLALAATRSPVGDCDPREAKALQLSKHRGDAGPNYPHEAFQPGQSGPINGAMQVTVGRWRMSRLRGRLW